MEKKNETLTYLEKNKGKTRAFRLLSGKLTRYERMPNGSIVPVHYSSNAEDERFRIIHLTEKGATQLRSAGYRLESAHAAVPKFSQQDALGAEKKPEINIPDNWETLSVSKLRALATLIKGERVHGRDECVEIIDSYIALKGANSEETEDDGSSDTE